MVKLKKGITLTGENFVRAMTLLRERYGNPYTLKNEITARENCDYVNLTPPRNNKEFPINFERRDKKITTQALVTSNDREPKCCFCKRNHYHDTCNVVTDVESRKK